MVPDVVNLGPNEPRFAALGVVFRARWPRSRPYGRTPFSSSG